ncbi:hypothetical protein B0I32_109178 [Nonomuraea fuscirosea]|uniref:Uncharacterized protein n=1 Tax=Nonomuraea fuscirosea TaxID=1291556 RepID=A0A2T0MYD5_9ACTN|nr:hypothetical protein [Nonomuraea fuscirosea]PRX64250.1 hypothetical protein B0I32_109178 [Nonomuraea fuscirosea]
MSLLHGLSWPAATARMTDHFFGQLAEIYDPVHDPTVEEPIREPVRAVVRGYARLSEGVLAEHAAALILVGGLRALRKMAENIRTGKLTPSDRPVAIEQYFTMQLGAVKSMLAEGHPILPLVAELSAMLGDGRLASSEAQEDALLVAQALEDKYQPGPWQGGAAYAAPNFTGIRVTVAIEKGRRLERRSPSGKEPHQKHDDGQRP